MLKQGLQNISTCSSLNCFFFILIGSNNEKLVTFTFGLLLFSSIWTFFVDIFCIATNIHSFSRNKHFKETNYSLNLELWQESCNYEVVYHIIIMYYKKLCNTRLRVMCYMKSCNMTISVIMIEWYSHQILIISWGKTFYFLICYERSTASFIYCFNIKPKFLLFPKIAKLIIN